MFFMAWEIRSTSLRIMFYLKERMFFHNLKVTFIVVRNEYRMCHKCRDFCPGPQIYANLATRTILVPTYKR